MGILARSICQPVAGWGNFPVEPAHVYRPEREQDLTEILREGEHGSYISRGLGRSYGDTALNRGGGVLLHTRLGRLLHFDPETGILECEAGVSLADIIRVFLPRGFFLPVTPGTKFVTVGGAIANDVHGKNHHRDGTFADHVLDFTLLLASGEAVRCSRTENAELFQATVGGIGLTGVILTARIRLMPVPSAYVEVEYRKAPDLERALALLAETESRARYSVAWIDCLSGGRSMGRSVLMLGDHAPAERLAGRAQYEAARESKLAIPINLPGWVLNPLSISAFNTLYYHKAREEQRLVHFDPFFYPLDAIRDWNRMYGKKGFVQYQVVLPAENSLTGLTAILSRLSKARAASFLAVLKSFGEEGQGLLSFPRKGYTLALDLPVRGQDLIDLLRDLDKQVLRFGGRIYLAKDAIVEPDVFTAMYPQVERFKAIKRQVDPAGLFASSMARRLGLVGVQA